MLSTRLPLLLLLGATLSTGWAEAEVLVTIDQVPAPVKAAILKAADGAKIQKIEQETGKDTVVYEAEWANADGKTTTRVTVAADGTVVKTETEEKHELEDAKPAK